MRHALLLILFTTLATAGEAEAVKLDPKLPPTVVAEMKDYDADVAKLKAKFDADVAKRAETLASALTKAETDTTKKGDLEGALAIKAAIEKLPIAKVDDLGSRVPTPAQKLSARLALNQWQSISQKPGLGRWVATTTGDGDASATVDGKITTRCLCSGGNKSVSWAADDAVTGTSISFLGRWDAGDDPVFDGEVFVNGISAGKFKDWKNDQALVVTFPSTIIHTIKLDIGAARNNPGVSEMYVR